MSSKKIMLMLIFLASSIYCFAQETIVKGNVTMRHWGYRNMPQLEAILAVESADKINLHDIMKLSPTVEKIVQENIEYAVFIVTMEFDIQPYHLYSLNVPKEDRMFLYTIWLWRTPKNDWKIYMFVGGNADE